MNSKIAKVTLLPDLPIYFMNIDDDFLFTMSYLPYQTFEQIKNIITYLDTCERLKNIIEIPIIPNDDAVDYHIDKSYAPTMELALEKWQKEF